MTSFDDNIFTEKKHKLRNKANDWDSSRKNTICILKTLARELDAFQRDLEAKKRKFAMAGMIGGGMTLVGVGLSFVTAGASLGLAGIGMTLTGAGCSVASGIAGFYQQGKETEKNKEMVEKAHEAVKQFTELSEEFMYLLKELQELAKAGDIKLEFKESAHERAVVKASAGVVVCSGSMMSALSGLGLLAANTGRVAAQAVNSGTLSVVSLVGNAVKYFGITDRLSKFATGVSGLRGFVTTVSNVATPGLRLVNVAGKVARLAGGGLSILAVGLDFKTYVDSSIKMNADKPSDVAEKIRRMARELENVTRKTR